MAKWKKAKFEGSPLQKKLEEIREVISGIKERARKEFREHASRVKESIEIRKKAGELKKREKIKKVVIKPEEVNEDENGS